MKKVECNDWRNQRDWIVFLRGILGSFLLAAFLYFSISCSAKSKGLSSIYTDVRLKRVMVGPVLLANVSIIECMDLAVTKMNATVDGDPWSFEIVPGYIYPNINEVHFENKSVSVKISGKISVANFLYYVSMEGRVGFELKDKNFIVFGL